MVVVWTPTPIYRLVVVALTPQQEAIASGLFPRRPTVQHRALVLGAKQNTVERLRAQLGIGLFVA